MPLTLVNGLSTNYQLLSATGAPAAEPVVFVHGMGTDSLASFYLTLAPPVAAAGFDVISYDLRGHGRTERPASGYTIKEFVTDLDELLRQFAADRRVHLVGNSFGGTLAYSYASMYPERVCSIVCIESEPPTPAWSEKMAAILSGTVEFLRIEENYAWIEANYSAHHRRLARLAADRISATSMAEEVPLGPLLTLDQVAAIECPVLSVLGSHGYQADDLEALTELLPAGELHVFEGQGHSVLVERHHEVRRLLLDWVRRHGVL
ncbi:Lysophospholipase, alpha-beta hydrolase superfamily [Amycolatopsis marina]|uniref:Lysophospholipase, alpha-beta hydrolase superfamily n=1 Tax=Amycolatopsis marina TaxID=490629 RepID=A0A1I1CDE2_9PSEU|nr:alpha/beta hydrolase [Amycolatopsis marina]SFB58888.1 Lysophospholipase, alpha-beta hydrolase superfamily [Amycolatopsis marina]